MVAPQLRHIRERANLTQEETALRADMDRAYLSEVENGKRSLSVDRLLRICGALNVRAADVVGEVEGQLLGKQGAALPNGARKRQKDS